MKPSVSVSWAEQARWSHRPALCPQAEQNKCAAEANTLLPSRSDLCEHPYLLQLPFLCSCRFDSLVQRQERCAI